MTANPDALERVKAWLDRWENGGCLDIYDPSPDLRSLIDRLEAAEAERDKLRDMLTQRTEAIRNAQPDPSVRRVSTRALDLLEESAEAGWALAETDDEVIEATALEMLVAWQREPAAEAQSQAVAGLVEAVRMAAERLSVEGQSRSYSTGETVLRRKMSDIAADIFQALAAHEAGNNPEAG